MCSTFAICSNTCQPTATSFPRSTPSNTSPVCVRGLGSASLAPAKPNQPHTAVNLLFKEACQHQLPQAQVPETKKHCQGLREATAALVLLQEHQVWDAVLRSLGRARSLHQHSATKEPPLLCPSPPFQFPTSHVLSAKSSNSYKPKYLS